MQKRNKELNRVVLLRLSEIRSNPNQPRTRFEQQDIRELAVSIEENGLLQPITVRKIEAGGYELIAGERRALAFRSLGKENIPAIIEEFSDEQSAVFALIENLQRKDLNFFEEASGIAGLIEELGLNRQQASERLGKAQSTIANKLRLLKFPAEARALMLEKNFTERHARAMLGIADCPKLIETIEYIADKGLNVEQTEDYIAKLTKDGDEKASPTNLFVIKDMRIFTNSINKAVSMLNLAGIDAVSRRIEKEDCVEFVINVPKKSL